MQFDIDNRVYFKQDNKDILSLNCFLFDLVISIFNQLFHSVVDIEIHTRCLWLNKVNINRAIL